MILVERRYLVSPLDLLVDLDDVLLEAALQLLLVPQRRPPDRPVLIVLLTPP